MESALLAGSVRQKGAGLIIPAVFARVVSEFTDREAVKTGLYAVNEAVILSATTPIGDNRWLLCHRDSTGSFDPAILTARLPEGTSALSPEQCQEVFLDSCRSIDVKKGTIKPGRRVLFRKSGLLCFGGNHLELRSLTSAEQALVNKMMSGDGIVDKATIARLDDGERPYADAMEDLATRVLLATLRSRMTPVSSFMK